MQEFTEVRSDIPLLLDQTRELHAVIVHLSILLYSSRDFFSSQMNKSKKLPVPLGLTDPEAAGVKNACAPAAPYGTEYNEGNLNIQISSRLP